MHRLEAGIRNYAWGSQTHIARLCGLPPSDDPVAEMWFGAHPGNPCVIEDGRTLLEAIDADPKDFLGEEVVRSFNGRLPFLMKLLAAAEPLSLQVHPHSERARIRFAEQEAAGIPLSARERSYPDASHKPELVYALTRFEGMAGFRDLHQTAQILRALELPWLDAVAADLVRSHTPFQTLRRTVTEFLHTDRAVVADRLQALRSAARAAEDRTHRLRVGRAGRRRSAVDPSAVERESLRVFAAVPPLVDRYPEDPGVLVTLLLNHVVLAAGEAMFIDAGMIHAYTSGFAVEIMASSDNVLRAGLTPKHVDIPELLAITNFTPVPPPQWAPSVETPSPGSRVERLTPPVEEFELAVVHVDDGVVPTNPGPKIVLCLSGELRVETTSESTLVGPGQAVFLRASESEAVLRGTAHAAVGRVPLALLA